MVTMERNRKSWVPDRIVSFSMTLSDPKSGFQGHCIRYDHSTTYVTTVGLLVVGCWTTTSINIALTATSVLRHCDLNDL